MQLHHTFTGRSSCTNESTNTEGACSVKVKECQENPSSTEWNEGIRSMLLAVHVTFLYSDTLVFMQERYVINYHDIQTIASGAWLDYNVSYRQQPAVCSLSEFFNVDYQSLYFTRF